MVSVTPRFITEPQSVEEFIGSSVNLLCSAEGFPAPVITWSYNGLPFMNATSNSGNTTNTESVIMISGLELSDGGSYSCQINSSATSMPLSSGAAIVAVIGGKIN